MFCGMLNVKTGVLRFSNAGHNPPLILGRDGAVEWLKLPHGMVLGVDPGHAYQTQVDHPAVLGHAARVYRRGDRGHEPGTKV